MDQPISHTDDLAPRDLGVYPPGLLLDMARCLAHDLQLADYGVLGKLTTEELVPRHTREVPLDALYGILNVMKVQKVTLPHTERPSLPQPEGGGRG